MKTNTEMAAPQLRGVFPAIPSLLRPDRQIDETAQLELAARLSDAGVQGMVALGSTGEGMSLDDARRATVLQATVEGVGGRGLVIAGCAGNATDEVIRRAEEAAADGSGAALIPCPYYYLLPQQALVQFYLDLAERAPIPLILYHIPHLTKNALTLNAIAELTQHERIIGIKDSDADFILHLRLLNFQTPSFSVLQGRASLLEAAYRAGAAGGITPVAALFPRLELTLRQMLESEHLGEASLLGKALDAAASLLRTGGFPLITNLKALHELMGLGDRTAEPPIPTASDEHLHLLAAALEQFAERWNFDRSLPS